jgi:hypothetical protein
VLGLGEAAGALNLLKNQLISQSTLGKARGEGPMDGMEMHGLMMCGRVTVGIGSIHGTSGLMYCVGRCYEVL